MQNHTTNKGFTLVELLVVISIIAILSGLLIPSIMYVQQESTRNATKADMNKIATALESYQTDFGDYPPSKMSDLTKEPTNNINSGNEALTASLMTTRKNGRYLNWDSNRYANLDGDKLSKNPTDWFFGDNELRELVDHWQNPIIYIHYRDYDKPEELGKYQNRYDDTFRVEAVRNPDTETFYNPTGFQLWSLGPNGQNDQGKTDDVMAK